MNKQNNQNNDSNPFADNTKDNSKIDNKVLQDPFAGHTTESIINPQKLDNNNQSFENNYDNPFASQAKGEINDSKLNDPFKQLDNDPFGKGTVASFNENQQPPMKNQYTMDEDKNPYGSSDNNNNDNPFASMNNSGNPYSGGDNPFAGQNNDFPKPDSNDNPFVDIPKNDNPYEGDKSVTDQKFVNQKVEGYNDVDNNHLTTLESQIKSDKKKPSE